MTDKINPKHLAEDIQNNVDRALKNPKDAQALEALHRDAQKLEGHVKLNPGEPVVDHNQVLQDQVQRELEKLEANGTLPKVTINMAGQIEASKVLHVTHVDELHAGETIVETTERTLLAGPNQETRVHDHDKDHIILKPKDK